MKLLALLGAGLLVCTCSAQTKPRHWKAATVLEITTTDDEIVRPRTRMVKRPGCQGGIGCYDSVPVEPLHIPTTTIVYWLETTDISYLVRQIIRRNGKPLNVTLHGQTRIAIDGMEIHILDDAGKDVKLPIVQKIANETPAK